MRTCTLGALFVCLVVCIHPVHAQSPEPLPMAYKAAATTTFANHPALPTCATIAVQDGDPGKGPSIITIRAKTGCVIPWHWHTPNERLIIVSGSGKGEMKGEQSALTLKPGDYLLLPSKGIHQFTALSDVELFDISDAPFDMHYVDAEGKEIPPDAALKAGTTGTSGR
jgi:quercetin dioxygenase-like cupin family protein